MISAGVLLEPGRFHPWVGHPGILVADISDLTDLDYGEFGRANECCDGNCTMYTKMQLVFQNETATIARWPNILPGPNSGRYQWQYMDGDSADGFVVTNTSAVSRIEKWGAEADPWVHAYTKYGWVDEKFRITGVSPVSSSGNITIHGSGPSGPSLVKYKQAKFYGLNLLCELDAPGEYFIDQDEKKVYFIPPVPLDQ
jgi:hypothetical protein